MPNVDEQIRSLLHDAAPRPSRSGLEERLARRRHRHTIRRRVGSGALAVAVLALTLAGLLELRRAFGGENEVPSSVGPQVSASPSEALTDVGFGFPVCRI